MKQFTSIQEKYPTALCRQLEGYAKWGYRVVSIVYDTQSNHYVAFLEGTLEAGEESK